MLVTRSFQGLHYLKLFDRDFSSADLLNPVVEFGRQPVHFCTSPLLPEMAISLSDGSIHLGDLQTMQFTGLMNPIDFASVDDRQCFRACEYGAHPRSLLVWDAKSVSNVDFRMPGTQLWKRLYSSSSSAFISCVKRHPTSPFQFTVASNESVALVDTRYAVSPLLEWGVNNSYESQLFLEFSKKSTMETTTIYSWGRKQAEIVAYSCRQDAARPPTAYRPVSFAPYHNHPSLKEKYGAQVPFVYLEDLRTQEKIVDDLDVPDWPPLIGFDVLEGKKGVHMFFLADDSSIFTQYYSTQSLDSPDIELVQAKCESVEAKCAKLERSHATIAVPHDAIGYESATVDLSIHALI